MRILFDTNVVLDDLLDRHPFVSDASRLMQYVGQGRIDGILCATTLTTMYYVASRGRSEPYARRQAYNLVRLFDVAPVDSNVLSGAFSLDFTDYEDAVLHEAADRVNADGIVTRNQRDFRSASLQIYSPDELLRVV